VTGGSATQTSSGTATRQRILEVAAALFARSGFHGTSTRDIAREVGIRQPSLFHHFPSKQAMLAELLERDLRPALDRIRCHRTAKAGAGTRLYAYLIADVAALTSSRFDARGLYSDEVLIETDLAPQRLLRQELHNETRRLIQEGIDSGEFRPIDTAFAQQVITGMLLDTIRLTGTHLADHLSDRPQEVADFVLLGLLTRTDDLDRVRGKLGSLLSGQAADC
jgi:AcrR family transcriptional regulator